MDRPAGAEVWQAGERRLARVESLRALAALGVVVGHAWGIGHAWAPAASDSYLERAVYGVGHGAFFLLVLTGHLLFWPFVRHHWGGGAAVRLDRYARNRALRILPLYLFAIALLLVLREGGGSFEQWWRFALFAQNFSEATLWTVDGPLWTLAVEMHFYALVPLVAWALSRASLRAATAIVALAGAVSLASWIAIDGRLWHHNLPGTFFFFAAGMLLAFLRLALERARPRWLDGPAGRADVWLAGAAALFLVDFADLDLVPLIAPAGFLLLGACVLPLREGRVVRALDWRPLALIGVASYSLYVWHMPVLEEAGAWVAAAVPAIVALAWVSYRLIEEPFLRLRRRWSPASAAIDELSPSARGSARAEPRTPGETPA